MLRQEEVIDFPVLEVVVGSELEQDFDYIKLVEDAKGTKIGRNHKVIEIEIEQIM